MTSKVCPHCPASTAAAPTAGTPSSSGSSTAVTSKGHGTGASSNPESGNLGELLSPISSQYSPPGIEGQTGTSYESAQLSNNSPGHPGPEHEQHTQPSSQQPQTNGGETDDSVSVESSSPTLQHPQVNSSGIYSTASIENHNPTSQHEQPKGGGTDSSATNESSSPTSPPTVKAQTSTPSSNAPTLAAHPTSRRTAATTKLITATIVPIAMSSPTNAGFKIYHSASMGVPKETPTSLKGLVQPPGSPMFPSQNATSWGSPSGTASGYGSGISAVAQPTYAPFEGIGSMSSPRLLESVVLALGTIVLAGLRL